MSPHPISISAVRPLIDDEHNMLYGLLDSVVSACPNRFQAESCKRDECQSLDVCAMSLDQGFAELIDYMLEHFAHEEQLMRNLGLLPVDTESFPLHAEAHADMSADVVRAMGQKDRLAQGKYLVATLEHWLGDHIATHDARLLRVIESVTNNAAIGGAG